MLFKLNTYCKRGVLMHRRLYNCTSKLILKEDLPGVAYQPDLVEKNKYSQWENNNFFKPEAISEKPNYSMVLPPPNVTGTLHLGHALGCTIQDVIARRKSCMQQNVLWVPGMDHAGIATQGVVEKYLERVRNTNRHSLGKDRFNDEIWRWKDKYGERINDQLRALGCSLDWSRHYFTLSLQHTEAVNTAFIQMFNQGLIYREKALVNWCPALKSTVSDIEVETLEIKDPIQLKIQGYDDPVEFGHLYSFAYKVFETNTEIVVSTTMPETMLGDVAIAVHPNDARYKEFLGKKVFHPFRKCIIPVILDEIVDMSFGTGAVKITPAHSKVDYNVAKAHKLPMLQVIDENGLMINSDSFNGLRRYDCRQKIVERLNDLGFMRGKITHEMSLPVCSRTGDVLELMPKEQWFVSCTELNKKAREAVLTGRLDIKPNKYIKNWLDWTGDNQDWCISRQLWWGHQIPAYKCQVDKKVVWVAAINEHMAREDAANRFKVNVNEIIVQRDPDVLDTWFSSGIYPFAALGWPNETKGFEDFYPLSLMATGHDILGFWVHRMVMLGLELTQKLPFKEVLLHGVICDAKGAKMSKSKGNVIDPVDVIKGISMDELKSKAATMHRNGTLTKKELDKALMYYKANFSQWKGIPECGTDALRFTLLSQDIQSNFVNFDISMCHANKLFCNKIWQSLKYVQMQCSQLPPYEDEISLTDLNYFDLWILSRLADMVNKVNNHMDDYDFHLATKALKQLIYSEFCDVYLETTKLGFGERNEKISYAHAHTLIAVLNTALRCLNPFMIYLTDELIPLIPTFEHNIIVNYNDLTSKHFHFPQFYDLSVWRNPDLERRVDKILDTAALVRELKGLCGMSDKLKPVVYLKTGDDDLKSDVINNSEVIKKLGQCCAVDLNDGGRQNYIKGVLNDSSEVFVEILGNDIDASVEFARNTLQKRIDKLEKSLAALERKFSGQKYLKSVPEYSKVLDKEKLLSKREQLKKLQQDLMKITSRSYSCNEIKNSKIE